MAKLCQNIMGSDNEVWQQYELYTWAVFAHVYSCSVWGQFTGTQYT